LASCDFKRLRAHWPPFEKRAERGDDWLTIGEGTCNYGGKTSIPPNLMNTLFENAVGSLQLGIEDYQANHPRRALSAVRNFYSSVLLLAKEVLVRHAPAANPEGLLGARYKPVPDGEGGVYYKRASHRAPIRLSPRLLRFARNDTVSACHCEERSDEAIPIGGLMTGIIRHVLTSGTMADRQPGVLPFGKSVLQAARPVAPLT
jgi:hypothetical protein